MFDPQYTVVLIRHAQSVWNLENRFSGWADPALTEEGAREARDAGLSLKSAGFRFDRVFTSYLQRANITADLILEALEAGESPLRIKDWRLNERHYGQLQGKLKDADANNTTEEQIWRWRRSYLDKAEPLLKDDPRHPQHSDLYKDVSPELLPSVENLADTRVRVAAFWKELVVPLLGKQRVLVSSHGNTLRALLMELANMSVEEVEGFEIPTGKPILVEYDHSGQFMRWHYLEI